MEYSLGENEVLHVSYFSYNVENTITFILSNELLSVGKTTK